MKWRPCWCPKAVLWELNSFLMPTLSFVPINLHTGHVGENAVYATSTFPIMHLICAPPPTTPKFCITFDFSWVLQPSQEKSKTMLIQFFLGGGGGWWGGGKQIRCVIRKEEVAYRRIALAVATVGP